MSILLMLSVAILPAVLLWIYVWKKDKQPEPAAQLLKAVMWGMAICIPIAIVEYVINTFLFGTEGQPETLVGSTAQAFFVAAVPEESCKLLALWIVLRKNPFFDEHYDGIVYAVCVGLGFAVIENIFYIIGNADQWAAVAVSRAFLAIPGHYAFAVVMGYYYSIYHFVNHSREIAWKIILTPVILHGIYDALCFSGSIDPTIGGVASIVLIYFCIKLQKYANKRVKEMVEHDKFKNINNKVSI